MREGSYSGKEFKSENRYCVRL